MIPILPSLKLSDLKPGDNVRVLDESSDFYGMVGVFTAKADATLSHPPRARVAIPVAATTEKGAWHYVVFLPHCLKKVDRVLAPP